MVLFSSLHLEQKKQFEGLKHVKFHFFFSFSCYLGCFFAEKKRVCGGLRGKICATEANRLDPVRVQNSVLAAGILRVNSHSLQL